MEKVKEILSDLKKSSILGLVGSILLIFCLISNVMSMHDILRNTPVIQILLQNLIYNLSYIGLIVYFIIISMRMYLKKGNINIAIWCLVILFAIKTVLDIAQTIIAIRYISLYSIIMIILDLVFTLYFLGILRKKPNFISNKIFAIVVIVYCIFLFIINMSFLQIVLCLGYLLIIPYFYNYYRILNGGNKNGK